MIVVVNYDLMNHDRDYPQVIAAIKSCGDTIRLLFSTWLVDTILTPQMVANRVNDALDADDRLFIDRLEGDAWTKNLPEVLTWLRSRSY